MGPKEVDMESAIRVIKAGMTRIDPDERIALVAYLMENYCPECGYPHYGDPCNCWNDE